MSDVITLGTIYLAEEGDTVSAFAVDGAQAGQVATGLRAAAGRVFNRGNRQTTVTFTRTRRPHEDVSAARIYCFDHDIALRGITATACTFRFTANGGTSERILSDAVVQSHRAEQIGLTTRHTYTVVGGTLT